MANGQKELLVATGNSNHQYWAIFTFALSLVLTSVCPRANTEPLASSECSASPDYLAKLQRFFGNNKPVQDYSCLTNYPSIAKAIKNYQLVDVRTKPEAPIKDAWIISIDELKLKSFLANRPLLLLDDGFSRVQMATACATLKKAGFTSVKMLVGGTAQWKSATAKKAPIENKTVSADQFIYEYFNGHVSVVAATESVSTTLKSAGFTEHRALPANKFSALVDMAITSTGNGYDPIVYIGTPADISQLEINQNLPNLYFLQGGVNSLIAQLQRDQLIEHARAEPQGIPFCAKK